MHRRHVIRAMTAGALGVGATRLVAGCESTTDTAVDATPQDGRRQRGIAETAPSHILFTAYDRTVVDAPIADLLRTWTATGRAMAQGRFDAPELADLGPARLTVTVGLGPKEELPSFDGDALEESRCGGEVGLQVCADDPMLVAQATSVLSRLAADVLRPKWQRLGFRPVHQTGTPRNLFGFKDGTANPTDLDNHVWLADGSTYLVVRQIAMDVSRFAALTVSDQEAVIGRRRGDGAPLGGSSETELADLYARRDDGSYVIPTGAHVRVADPGFDGGARMLRRGYSYVDSSGEVGLLFVAFMRDPHTFVRVQRRLAAGDQLSRFTQTRGSALFWVPPSDQP